MELDCSNLKKEGGRVCERERERGREDREREGGETKRRLCVYVSKKLTLLLQSRDQPYQQ